MVGMITGRLRRPRRPPPVVLLLVSAVLLASLWWVLSGPAGSLSGQPCYRGWLRIVVARTDRGEAFGWTLLRHAIFPVGGPQESRVYVRPEPGATDSVRDVSLLAFRVWAPGRDAAGVQRSLDESANAPIAVEPLCAGA